MYGFLHCALADMILKNYTEDKWKEILKEAGIELDGGCFLIHSVYPDDETDSLFAACCKVLGEGREEFLEAFGCHFMAYCFESGYDGILRVLGATLFDFLRNLDALHNHLAWIYPGMEAPAFRCELKDEGHILLHYHSKRSDLYPIAVGLVKSIAREIYNTDVDVIVMQEETSHETTHAIILVSDLQPERPRQRLNSFSGEAAWPSESFNPQDSKFSSDFFCKAFPFHLMFDENLKVIQIGDALLRHMRMRNCKAPFFLEKLFDIDRPIMSLQFKNILRHLDNLFVLSLKSEHGRPLCLKGQMVHVPESQCILLLSSPRARTLEELREQGLYLSDIPLHDKTREVLLLQDAGWMERELVEKLEETTNNLKKLQTKLTEDKNSIDDLVHSILPTKVADKLRRHESIEAENFDMVSALYTDVVEFTALGCNEAVQPMDIIRLLNRLYSDFDTIVSSYGVYKVETIGDAYIVASGIPEYREDHADRVLDVALDMMAASKEIRLPGDLGHIQIRMGINSGPCTAGVVGKKMPRYCLFGNTVTMVTAIEGCSEPGKINISQATRSCLVDPGRFIFEENSTDGKLSFKCFFVTARRLQTPSLSAVGCSAMPGLFCSPCASPAGSRRTSADMGADNSIQLPDELTMPTRVNSTTTAGDRRATIGAKIQHYSHVEAILRQKLRSKGVSKRGIRRNTEDAMTSQGTCLRRATSHEANLYRHSEGSDWTESPIRRINTVGGDEHHHFPDMTAGQASRKALRRHTKPSPIQVRALATPVEIRLTPPPNEPSSGDEERTLLEIDGEDIREDCFSSQPQGKDFSIFCLPRIQETLDRKLKMVCNEKKQNKWDFIPPDRLTRRDRLSSSDSIG